MCTACQEKGDAITLVSWALLKHGKPRGREYSSVMRWIEDRTTVDLDTQPEPEPQRPPEDGVRAAMSEADPVATAAHYALDGFLKRRGLSRKAPAWILPSRFQRRDWWPYPFAHHWPLIVPCYNAVGRLVSIHGRALDDRAPRKTTWPRDTDAGGLIFASDIGLRLLRKQDPPPRVLLITEGIMDYLSASERAPVGVAVWGITSGAIQAFRVLRVPSSTTVVVATDYDRQGEIYAQHAAEALAPHPVHRAPWRATL